MKTNISLYNNLLKNISYAVAQSLNEMAKAVLRTIDKKLWLSIASTCSRNKSTQAEFVKPLSRLTKDDLILRYVAALIIMKKPCPETVEDINDLKTFKFIGNRAIELGASIDDIKDLYNKNKGELVLAANKLTNKETTVKQKSEKPVNKPEPVSKSMNDDLFGDDDDDFFNDSYDSDTLVTNITTLDKATPLSVIFSKQIGIAKPNGFKYIKHTADEYDKFVRTNVSGSPWYPYSMDHYIKKFITLLNTKKWEKYIIPAPTGQFHHLFMCLECEKCNNDNEVEKLLNNFVETYRQYKSYKFENMFNECKQYLDKRKKYINTILKDFVKNIFNTDTNTIALYISPDNGLMLKITKLPTTLGRLNTMFLPLVHYEYTVTFTEEVNYFSATKDKDENKRILTLAKLNEKKKRIFKNIIRKYCGLGSFNWIINIDFDGYPYMETIYKNTTTVINIYKAFTRQQRSGKILYILNPKVPNLTELEYNLVWNTQVYPFKSFGNLLSFKNPDGTYTLRFNLDTYGKQFLDDELEGKHKQ